MHKPLVLSLLALSVLGAACSTAFRPKACASDNDCGDGLACVQADETPTCTKASDAPLRIGMSAPVSGPSRDLGIEMRTGIKLAFDAQNAAGGIHGRPIELDFRDDEYRPENAEAAARELLDVAPQESPARCPTTTVPVVAGQQPVASGALMRGQNAVLGLVGSVGTPTMVRSAPIAVETQSLFFGAFTGAARMLRDGASGPCARYIFNVRASYAQEARATLEHFFMLQVPNSRHLMSFDQNDSFGQAGYDGLVAAYTATKGNIDPPFAPNTPIARFRYARDDEGSVPAQVTAATKYLGDLLASDSANHTVGIFMTDTYGPATNFIVGLRDWQYANDAEQTATRKASRLTIHFANVSFVGPNSLAKRLKEAGSVQTPTGSKPYSDGVYVSQVVPNYATDNSDVVREYKTALTAAGIGPSFTSLEGYLTGRVFAAGLANHKGLFTPETLIETFEKLPQLGLGLGASSGFSKTDHNYSKSVFGTAISADGSFVDRYFWTEGRALQLFE